MNNICLSNVSNNLVTEAAPQTMNRLPWQRQTTLQTQEEKSWHTAVRRKPTDILTSKILMFYLHMCVIKNTSYLCY